MSFPYSIERVENARENGRNQQLKSEGYGNTWEEKMKRTAVLIANEGEKLAERVSSF
jgi:hypothetical protein